MGDGGDEGAYSYISDTRGGMATLTWGEYAREMWYARKMWYAREMWYAMKDTTTGVTVALLASHFPTPFARIHRLCRDCGMECGMRNAECGMRNAECHQYRANVSIRSRTEAKARAQREPHSVYTTQ